MLAPDLLVEVLPDLLGADLSFTVVLMSVRRDLPPIVLLTFALGLPPIFFLVLSRLRLRLLFLFFSSLSSKNTAASITVIKTCLVMFITEGFYDTEFGPVDIRHKLILHKHTR